MAHPDAPEPWASEATEDLAELCGRDPLSLTPPNAASAGDFGASQDGPERVLLLALTPGDRGQAQRLIAELEGLVVSAGAVSVGVVEQRRSQVAPRLSGVRGKWVKRPWRPGGSAPPW